MGHLGRCGHLTFLISYWQGLPRLPQLKCVSSKKGQNYRVDTPLPKGGGFKLRLKAGSVRRSVDSGHIEVVIWFRRLLALYVLHHPYD
jgi:hypothetical protein